MDLWNLIVTALAALGLTPAGVLLAVATLIAGQYPKVAFLLTKIADLIRGTKTVTVVDKVGEKVVTTCVREPKGT